MSDRVISTRALVEAMIREDATVEAAELYAVADLLGMGDQQVRLAVKRLIAEGRFEQAGRGRAAVLHATEQTRAAIEPEREYLRLMYAQDRGESPWDGSWHLVGFAVPESERGARSGIRDIILSLGGAAVQGGLYVSPHAWEDALRAAARDLGCEAYITTLSCADLDVGGERGAAAAKRLWAVDDLAVGHQRLLRLAEAALAEARSADHAARLAMSVQLAAEFTRAHENDPLLPPELLPPEWIGARARSRAADAWTALASAEPDSTLQLFRWYSATGAL